MSEGKIDFQTWICPICCDDHRKPEITDSGIIPTCKFEDLADLRGEINQAVYEMDKAKADRDRLLNEANEERKEIIFLLRFCYLTLGYYGTPYNYDPKNNVTHPISGEVCSGIMYDGGSDAREASEKVRASKYFQELKC